MNEYALNFELFASSKFTHTTAFRRCHSTNNETRHMYVVRRYSVTHTLIRKGFDTCTHASSSRARINCFTFWNSHDVVELVHYASEQTFPKMFKYKEKKRVPNFFLSTRFRLLVSDVGDVCFHSCNYYSYWIFHFGFCRHAVDVYDFWCAHGTRWTWHKVWTNFMNTYDTSQHVYYYVLICDGLGWSSAPSVCVPVPPCRTQCVLCTLYAVL